MSGNPRSLPTWMSNKDAAQEKSGRKPRAARSVFYCMNEQELVEAAVTYLTAAAPPPDHKVPLVGDEAADTTVTIGDKPVFSKTKSKSMFQTLEEESSDCSHDHEATYISETDLDITEVETLPYTESQGLRDQRSGPVQDPGTVVNAELDPDKLADCSQTPADAAQQEDDSLQLVREIFFT